MTCRNSEHIFGGADVCAGPCIGVGIERPEGVVLVDRNVRLGDLTDGDSDEDVGQCVDVVISETNLPSPSESAQQSLTIETMRHRVLKGRPDLGK